MVDVAEGREFVLGASQVISVSSVDSNAIDAFGGNSLHILGAASGAYFGIRSTGDHPGIPGLRTETFIGETGYVSAKYTAYSMINGNDYIVNKGTIYGRAVGVGTEDAYRGVFKYLENSGLIMSGTDATVLGHNAAVYLNGEAAEVTELENSGTIKALLSGSFAILSDGNTSDQVTNTGELIGKVSLGAGNDRFDTTSGKLQGSINAGDGNDTVFGSAADDSINGSLANDSIKGNGGNDKLAGDDGNDTIDGGNDNDSLTGGANSDTLTGGSGNDTLNGGTGHDRLTGGSGADQFRFVDALSSSSSDTIVDFTHTEDKVALDDARYTALGSSISSDEFVATTSGHAAVNASQHLLYDKSNGELWYDSNGNGSGGLVFVAQFGTTASHPTNLTYSDFAIV